VGCGSAEMVRTQIVIINVHWSCGDGCCSESWNKVEVRFGSGHTVRSWDEFYTADSALEKGMEIAEDLGVPAEEIDVFFEDEYEGGEE
jgi:hypothetical protein